MLSSLIKNSTKQFPNFIRESTALAVNSEVEDKIFPKIGLPNAKEKIEGTLDFAKLRLDKVIHLAVKKYLTEFSDRHFLGDIQGLELIKMAQIIHIFGELNRRFTREYGIDIDGDSVKLEGNIPSYDGKVLVKSGTDCFKLVQDLLTQGSKYAKVDLVNHDEIVEQCKNLQIAFSSSELEGAWDIATMSMRGIKSCMRWEARQSPSLIGSITDPCCGIIYLTNGTKTQYGSKMLFRALVRVMINQKTMEPALLVDRLYSSFYKNKPDECNDLDEQVKKMFVKYLRDKSPNTLVFEAVKDRAILFNYSLPYPPNHSMLPVHEHSYRDTVVVYASGYKTVEPGILKAFEKQPVKVVKAKPKKKTVKAKSKTVSVSLKAQ